jgi:hypothetical protein
MNHLDPVAKCPSKRFMPDTTSNPPLVTVTPVVAGLAQTPLQVTDTHLPVLLQSAIRVEGNGDHLTAYWVQEHRFRQSCRDGIYAGGILSY